ncbi:DUF222 domain-containing protein [Kutzneria sp. NPDC052558]|uniref:DUF222 domain-containing protein n=1 Tax=Kutzneria sp. NPDC052558 TaxID=3364121 RepID=UPI0037C772F5
MLDQDGKAPDVPELAQPTRELYITRRANGSFHIHGHVDPETGAMLEAAIASKSKPTSADDTRTTPQRQGDAFAEITAPRGALSYPLQSRERLEEYLWA